MTSLSTKRRGSNTVSWTADTVCQHWGGMLISSQLAGYVDEWIPLGGRVNMLRLNLLDRSLCLIQVYGPNSCALCLEFAEETSVAREGL